MIGQDYFDMLNEVEQSQFANNFETCRLDEDDKFSDFLTYEFDDFDSFISSAFVFNMTPEGGEYWKGIRDSQRDGVDASERRNGSPKSLKDLFVLAMLHEFIEKSDDSGDSLEDILKELKITLPDDKV